jgi:hypothetical protein
MQRFGQRIDAAVGRAMHGQRADTHPPTQWAEALFVPTAHSGKTGIHCQDVAVAASDEFEPGRED